MNSISKLELLCNIFSLINGEEYQATIASLSKDCNIPLPYMRKTMVALLKNKIIKCCLYSSDDLEQDTDSPFSDLYDMNPDETADKILNGDFDNLQFDVTFNLLNTNESELLSLSRTEYLILGTLGENAASLRRISWYEKKDNTNPVPKEIRLLQDKLISASLNKRAVNFTYHKPNGTSESVTCFPYEIITNVTDNWIYLKTANGKHYRLDRIAPGCNILSIEAEPTLPEADKSQKYMWGIFKKTDIPEHVKVIFFVNNEEKLNKLKNDIDYRKETYTLTDKGDYYIYEDDVIGIDEFQRWVRCYGPSMVVLEPQDQKRQILERAQETLDLYKKSKAWSEL